MSQNATASQRPAAAAGKAARPLRAATLGAVLAATLAGCAGALQQPEVTAMLHGNGRAAMSDAGGTPTSRPHPVNGSCGAETLSFVTDCGGFARYEGP